MDRLTLAEALVDAVREIQQHSCRPLPGTLDSTTKPLRDLVGFDSLNCLEVEVLLSARLKTEISNIPFWDTKERRALPIHEIVDRLCKAEEYE